MGVDDNSSTNERSTRRQNLRIRSGQQTSQEGEKAAKAGGSEQVGGHKLRLRTRTSTADAGGPGTPVTPTLSETANSE